MNQRQNPSDENEYSHRDIIFDEHNDEHQMKMNALAEHPKVIANHQVLRQNVESNTPRGILADYIIWLHHELVPEEPKHAAECQGDEKLSMNANSCTSQSSACNEPKVNNSQERKKENYWKSLTWSLWK